MSNQQQREELHRTIWNIADEQRGAVGGWEFKAYAGREKTNWLMARRTAWCIEYHRF